MDRKPQLTENEIMCRDLMERNGEIDGLRKWAADREAVCASLAELRTKAFDDLCSAFVKHASVSGLDDGDSITVREATDALLHCAEQLREGEIK